MPSKNTKKVRYSGKKLTLYKLLLDESLSNNLSNEAADLKICSLLTKISVSELKGHLISVSNQGITIKKYLPPI